MVCLVSREAGGTAASPSAQGREAAAPRVPPKRRRSSPDSSIASVSWAVEIGNSVDQPVQSESNPGGRFCHIFEYVTGGCCRGRSLRFVVPRADFVIIVLDFLSHIRICDRGGVVGPEADEARKAGARQARVRSEGASGICVGFFSMMALSPSLVARFVVSFVDSKSSSPSSSSS